MTKIGKKLLLQLKSKLEKERAELEEELKSFAKKSKSLKDDWNTRFPRFNGEGLEEAADEVEEYSTLLPIEYSLELKLREVNFALGKIRKGKYGICENCKKQIGAARLKACPEAKYCSKCIK